VNEAADPADGLLEFVEGDYSFLRSFIHYVFHFFLAGLRLNDALVYSGAPLRAN
jgi:hypothetical protein